MLTHYTLTHEVLVSEQKIRSKCPEGKINDFELAGSFTQWEL